MLASCGVTLAGTALYVHLMVYTGLSLFIIRRANVYLVVCVLTRITLHVVKNSTVITNDFVLEVSHGGIKS